MKRCTYPVAVVTIALAACGGSSPAAPSTPAPANGLLFADAAYVLGLRANSLACGNGQNPLLGPSVGVTVKPRRDGTAWVAANSSGTLTLRLENGPPSAVPFSIGIAGTARGFADDEGVVFDPLFMVPPNGTHISIAGDAPLVGSMSATRSSDFSQGTINGTVTFSSAGVATTCQAGSVFWMLTRGAS